MFYMIGVHQGSQPFLELMLERPLEPIAGATYMRGWLADHEVIKLRQYGYTVEPCSNTLFIC